MAEPTPPPITATFFNPSTSEATPKGPTKSQMLSPSSSPLKAFVVLPTTWKIIVTVPFSLS